MMKREKKAEKRMIKERANEQIMKNRRKRQKHLWNREGKEK